VFLTSFNGSIKGFSSLLDGKCVGIGVITRITNGIGADIFTRFVFATEVRILWMNPAGIRLRVSFEFDAKWMVIERSVTLTASFSGAITEDVSNHFLK